MEKCSHLSLCYLAFLWSSLSVAWAVKWVHNSVQSLWWAVRSAARAVTWVHNSVQSVWWAGDEVSCAGRDVGAQQCAA